MRAPNINPMNTKITGQDLINYREHWKAQGATNAGIVRAAGYITIRKDGTQRLNFTEFYENILIARGRMWRITVNVAENTSAGAQPIWSDSFTTSSRSARSVAHKVRALTHLTGARCKRVVENGVVKLYPYRSNQMVAYNLPA
jgi:hypothetical protein